MPDRVIVSVGEAKLAEPAIAFDSLFEPNTARVLEDMKKRYLKYVEKATERSHSRAFPESDRASAGERGEELL